MAPLHLLFFATAAASDSSSELIYDISLNNKKIGHRNVKVEFLPLSAEHPRGGRKISVWTEVSTQFSGKSIEYKQRASSLIRPQKPKKFISSSSLNGDLLEIQGRQKKDGKWLITYIKPSNITSKIYNSHELHAPSLDLFDPGQFRRWEGDQRNTILLVESDFEPMYGKWSVADNQQQEFSNSEEIEKT